MRPPRDEIDDYADAIAELESRGSGGYAARGPVTKRGDRAYGRYQVMGANIPAWTYMATGKSMTPEEFAASPEAQDAVFRHQFGSMVKKYGNANDAASVWFTGQPLAKGAGRSDGYNTGSQYVAKFNKALDRGRVRNRAMSYSGEDDPGDEEIIKRYTPKPSTKPPSGWREDDPGDEAILKMYAPKEGPEERPKSPPAGTRISIGVPYTGEDMAPNKRIEEGFEELPRARYTEGKHGEARYMPASEGDQRFDYMLRHPEKPENLMNILALLPMRAGPKAAAGTIGGLARGGYQLAKGATLATILAEHGIPPSVAHLLHDIIP